MPVIINYKVCDLGRGCPCIPACPTSAWYWDEKNKRPAVDNSKCNNCGICTKTCPARVISGALDEKGIEKLKRELDSDPRAQKTLCNERFNIEPKDELIAVDSFTFEKEVLNSEGVIIVDFWAPEFSARCKNGTMLYSELLPETGHKVKFKKMNVHENEAFCRELGITTLPALVVYHKGEIVDHIAAKIGLAEKEQIQERITDALKSISLRN